MFKQLVILLAIVCSVASASATTVKDSDEVQESKGALFDKFNEHVKDLIATTGKSTMRGYEEAKPAVNNIRGDLAEVGQTIANHPTVVKGVEYVKPHYEAVKGKTAELLTVGNKKVNELRARFAASRQQKGREQGGSADVELRELKPEVEAPEVEEPKVEVEAEAEEKVVEEVEKHEV